MGFILKVDLVDENTLNENRDNFSNAVEGSITFTANGTEETLVYVPVEQTDWMMVVLIRESVIQDRIRSISEKNLATNKRQIAFTVIFSALFFSVLLFMLKALSKKDLDAEKANSNNFKNMASTDSLTGIRNKHAYSEAEAQEKGFDTMHEVIEDINRVIEDNIKKKEVVIAIGHSELTKDDQLVHDVFERADEMMYQRKQELNDKRVTEPIQPIQRLSDKLFS